MEFTDQELKKLINDAVNKELSNIELKQDLPQLKEKKFITK